MKTDICRQLHSAAKPLTCHAALAFDLLEEFFEGCGTVLAVRHFTYFYTCTGVAWIMAEVVPFPVEYSQRYTVPVVDDEPAIRGVLCEFLADCGLNSLTTGNADEAVAIIGSGESVDLVLSDVRMPGAMDGCDLARWILANRPELPVILATGDLAKANAAAGLTGIETFAKP